MCIALPTACASDTMHDMKKSRAMIIQRDDACKRKENINQA